MKSEFLGKENITSLLFKLSMPAIIGMLVASLYNIVDTIFLGQWVGTLAIGALAIAFPIQLLLVSIAQAIGIGAASIVSRKLGEKKANIACKATGTAICFVTVTSVILTILLYLFMKHLIVFFGATETLVPYTEEYLFYIGIGFTPSLLSMTLSSLIRAEGNAKTVMYGMLLGTILNIALDPVFILVLDMGIKGAAIATIISQYCSFYYFANYYVKGKSAISLKLKDFRIKIHLLQESILLGLPNFIRMAGMSILIIIINNVLGSYGGDLAISTYGMINRLFSLTFMPVLGVSQGFQPIAGYNFGAGNLLRLREVILKGILMASVASTAGFLLMMLIPKTLFSMFTSDINLIQSSASALRICIIFVPILGFQMISAAYFQAVGKKVPALILSLLRQFILLIPLLIIFPSIIGINGVWISFPIADCLSTIVTFIILIMEFKHLGLIKVKSIKLTRSYQKYKNIYS